MVFLEFNEKLKLLRDLMFNNAAISTKHSHKQQY